METDLGEKSDNVNDLRRQLEAMQSQLDEARKRYTPEHPDRMRLEATVRSLQADLDAAIVARKASQPADATSPGAAPGGAASPFDGRKSLSPTDADNPAFVQIQAQLSGTENDITSLNAQIGKLQGSIRSYESDVTGSPQVEREYHDLTRDLDNARACAIRRFAPNRARRGSRRASSRIGRVSVST